MKKQKIGGQLPLSSEEAKKRENGWGHSLGPEQIPAIPDSNPQLLNF